MDTYELHSSRSTFLFEFSFDQDEPLTPPASPPYIPEYSPPASPPTEPGVHTGQINKTDPYAQVLIYRMDKPNEYYMWSGSLPAEPAIEFDLRFDDDDNLKGSFSLFQNTEIGHSFVFFDAMFGINYIYNFEGAMASFPSTPD